jgi:hypothetical protein
MWAAVLGIAITGLGHERAGAIEEIVVRGHRAVAAEPTTVAQDLQDGMSAYLQALNAEQKARIDAALLRQRGEQIQIAAAKVPTRG